MPYRIAVIDATRVSLAPVDGAAAAFPGLSLLHLMDEGMSQLAKEEGRISGKNLARMVSLIRRAEELGVDGILLSCTIFTPYLDLLSIFTDLPLVAADAAMFEQAAETYPSIGVVVTFGPTVDSVTAVLEQCKAKGLFTDAQICVAEGAFDALQNGREEEHNRLVASCARNLAERCDAVVLAQMSQMRAVPLLSDLKVPLLTSPPVSIRFLLDQIDARRKKG
jgi:Asp/Glu/hydantoin racemase